MNGKSARAPAKGSGGSKTAYSLDRLVHMLGPRANPEPGWLSEVVGCTVETAERAIGGITAREAQVVELCDNISRSGRTYYAQFPAPIELYAFVKLTKPGLMVESGVASGVSSAFLLLGASSNRYGALYSMDLPVVRRGRRGDESWAIPPGLTSGWAIPTALRRNWTLLTGRSEDLLGPLLRDIGSLDLYCHDSPVSAEHLEFEMKSIVGHLRRGSLVVADNTGANRKAFAAAADAFGTSPIRRRRSDLAAFRVPQAWAP